MGGIVDQNGILAGPDDARKSARSVARDLCRTPFGPAAGDLEDTAAGGPAANEQAVSAIQLEAAAKRVEWLVEGSISPGLR